MNIQKWVPGLKFVSGLLLMIISFEVRGSAQWPNEPAGSVVITDQPFNIGTFPCNYCKDSYGWLDVYNSGHIVQNPNGRPAPFSSPDVIQWNYTTSLNNSSPGTLDYNFVGRPTNKLYSAFWFMVSNNFAEKGAGVKLFMNFQGDGRTLINWTPVLNAENGQAVIGMYNAGTLDNSHLVNGGRLGSMNLYGDVRPNYAITPGEWHRIEMYLQVSTSTTSKDGVVRMWVDGNLVMNYTTVNMVTNPFYDVQVYSSYHGTPPDNSMYIWYDHVHVSDASGTTTSNPLSISTMSNLPSARASVAYAASLQAQGGTTPYGWTVTSGSLLPGLSLNKTTGLISGTPTTSGRASFTAKVTDARGDTAARAFTIIASTSGIPSNMRSSGNGNLLQVNAQSRSVRFELAGRGAYVLGVTDVAGRRLWMHYGADAANGVEWKYGEKIRQGVYWVVLEQGGEKTSRKLMISK